MVGDEVLALTTMETQDELELILSTPHRSRRKRSALEQKVGEAFGISVQELRHSHGLVPG